MLCPFIDILHGAMASNCRAFAVRRSHLVLIPVKVTDILDYETAVSFSIENSSAQHDVVAGATEGPVAPRLDRLIR